MQKQAFSSKFYSVVFDWLGAVWQHLVDVRTFLLMRHLTKEHHRLLLSIFTLCVGCQRCVVENGAATCTYERFLVHVLNFLFFGADKFKYCKSLWNPWMKNILSKSEFSLTRKLKRTPQKDRTKSEICTFDMLQTDYCANALLAKTIICSSHIVKSLYKVFFSITCRPIHVSVVCRERAVG